MFDPISTQKNDHEYKIHFEATLSPHKTLQIVNKIKEEGWCNETVFLASGFDIKSIPDPRIQKILAEINFLHNGLIVFLGNLKATVLVPPLPIMTSESFHGFKSQPILEFFQTRPTFAVVLIRLGNYAVGVIKGHKLVSSKTGSRLVKNRHKKGGSSQRRFERGRERQIRELFDKVCIISKTIFLPYEDEIDYIFFGGDRHVISNFHIRCPSVKKFDLINRQLPVHRPGLKALQSIEKEIWKTHLIEFIESENTLEENNA